MTKIHNGFEIPPDPNWDVNKYLIMAILVAVLIGTTSGIITLLSNVY